MKLTPIFAKGFWGTNCTGFLTLSSAPGWRNGALVDQNAKQLPIDFNQLKNQHHVETILCLLPKEESKILGIDEEDYLCFKMGIQFIPYPIGDRGIPDDLFGFRHLVAQITQERIIGKNQNVLIHCKAGIGRTGLVGASFLRYARVQDPIEEIKRILPGSMEIDNQVQFVQKLHFPER